MNIPVLILISLLFQGSVFSQTPVSCLPVLSPSVSRAGLFLRHSISPPWIKAHDHFGNSMDSNGNTLAIGAYFQGIGSINNSGAVYLYEREGLTWKLDQVLLPDPIDENRHFGHSVALSSNFLVVGAWNNGRQMNDKHVVFVYQKKEGRWQLIKKLRPSNNEKRGVDFGWSVATDGNHIVASAKNPLNSPGAVYVYEFHSDHLTNIQRLEPPPILESRFEHPYKPKPVLFGNEVSISGNYLFVSASTTPYRTQGNRSGIVFIYEKRGTRWYFQQTLRSPNPTATTEFGTSIVSEGETLLVGAMNYKSSLRRGAVFEYSLKKESWELTQILQPNYQSKTVNFGTTLSLHRDLLAVGTGGPWHSWGSDPLPIAHLYERVRSGPQKNKWQERNTIIYLGSRTPNDNLGSVVSVANGSLLISDRNQNFVFYFSVD